ncbi:unnamed protein product, partial [Ascophyllum nodosum]
MDNLYSNTLQEFNGDLTVNGGQLGLHREISISADITLWDEFVGANRYVIDPTVDGLSVKLPVFNTTGRFSRELVMHGHAIWINNPSLFTFNVTNETDDVVISLPPSTTVKLTASINEVSKWRVFGIMKDDVAVPRVVDIQDAYDNTAAGDSALVFTAAQGELDLVDAALPIGEMLSLYNNDKSSVYFSSGTRTVSGVTGPYLQALSGSASAANSVAIGGVNVSGSGSVGIVDTQGVYGLTGENTLFFGYGNIQSQSGPSSIGNEQSDVLTKEITLKNESVTYLAVSDVVLIDTILPRTIYHFTLETMG